MGAPRSGKNGLIYISGTEITGANSWSINIEVDMAETPQFGDGWKKRIAGLNDWSGNVAAWDQGDDQVLQTAATAGISVALLIYPDRSTLTSYYSGNAIFSFGSEGDTASPVGNSVDFSGDDTLTIAGFA